MDLIKEINDKYLALEAEIDKKLEKVEAEEIKWERQTEKLAEKLTHIQPTKVLSYEEALMRNTNTLKSLEIAKARLRSRSTFSPVEKLLKHAIEDYKNELNAIIQQNTEKGSVNAGGVQQNSERNNDGVEDEDEDDDLYKLVMQNVLEASNKSKVSDHRRQH